MYAHRDFNLVIVLVESLDLSIYNMINKIICGSCNESEKTFPFILNLFFYNLGCLKDNKPLF